MHKLAEIFCIICTIIMLVIVANSLIGDLAFRFKYSFPEVTETTNRQLSTSNEPIQKNYTQQKLIQAQGEKNKYHLQAQAEYSITGLVVAFNTNFFFRDILRTPFDDICLMDIGLVWGGIADKDLLRKHFKFKSKKTLGNSRVLHYKWDNNVDYACGYVTSHLSHTHLIPSNKNVMAALLKIKKGEVVKLSGYLVDIYTDKSVVIAQGSLSRSDTNATSRGYGACEILYVTALQIGDKIYK